MRQFITALLTLCLVTVVIPPISTTPDTPNENEGISTCEYIISDNEN